MQKVNKENDHGSTGSEYTGVAKDMVKIQHC
jgi:hypothetical protein